MSAAYPVDPSQFAAGQDGGIGEQWVWLYCPVCSATYPVAPFEDASCPNADQLDHQDVGGRR